MQELLLDACGPNVLLGAFNTSGKALALNEAARPFFAEAQAGACADLTTAPTAASHFAARPATAVSPPDVSCCSLASFFRLAPHAYANLQTAVLRGETVFTMVLPVPLPTQQPMRPVHHVHQPEPIPPSLPGELPPLPLPTQPVAPAVPPCNAVPAIALSLPQPPQRLGEADDNDLPAWFRPRGGEPSSSYKPRPHNGGGGGSRSINDSIKDSVCDEFMGTVGSGDGGMGSNEEANGCDGGGGGSIDNGGGRMPWRLADGDDSYHLVGTPQQRPPRSQSPSAQGYASAAWTDNDDDDYDDGYERDDDASSDEMMSPLPPISPPLQQEDQQHAAWAPRSLAMLGAPPRGLKLSLKLPHRPNVTQGSCISLSSALSSSSSRPSSAQTHSGLPSAVSSAGGWRMLTPAPSRHLSLPPPPQPQQDAAVADRGCSGGGKAGAEASQAAPWTSAGEVDAAGTCAQVSTSNACHPLTSFLKAAVEAEEAVQALLGAAVGRDIDAGEFRVGDGSCERRSKNSGTLRLGVEEEKEEKGGGNVKGRNGEENVTDAAADEGRYESEGEGEGEDGCAGGAMEALGGGGGGDAADGVDGEVGGAEGGGPLMQGSSVDSSSGRDSSRGTSGGGRAGSGSNNSGSGISGISGISGSRGSSFSRETSRDLAMPRLRNRRCSATHDGVVELSAPSATGSGRGGPCGADVAADLDLDMLPGLQLRPTEWLRNPSRKSATGALDAATVSYPTYPNGHNHHDNHHDHHHHHHHRHPHFLNIHRHNYNYLHQRLHGPNHHHQYHHYQHHHSVPYPLSPPIVRRTACTATDSATQPLLCSNNHRGPRRCTTRERLLNLLSSLDSDGAVWGTAATTGASDGCSRSGSFSVLSTSPNCLGSGTMAHCGTEGADAVTGVGCTTGFHCGSLAPLVNLNHERSTCHPDMALSPNSSCDAVRCNCDGGSLPRQSRLMADWVSGEEAGAHQYWKAASPPSLPSPQSYGWFQVHITIKRRLHPEVAVAATEGDTGGGKGQAITVAGADTADAAASAAAIADAYTGAARAVDGLSLSGDAALAIDSRCVFGSDGATAGNNGGANAGGSAGTAVRSNAVAAAAASADAGTGATATANTAAGEVLLLFNATLVNDWVGSQQRLEVLLQEEHKTLEAIFPRHVIEHVARKALSRPASTRHAACEVGNTFPCSGSGSTASISTVNGSFNAHGCGRAAATATGMAAAAAAAAARSDPVSLTCSEGVSGVGGGGDPPLPLATAHRCVTVLFADIVGFTSMCNCLQPLEVMNFLNGLFTRFDTLCDIYGVYKVETIGDCFMAVGGLIAMDGEGFKAVRGNGSEDFLHALKVMSFAKAMVREVAAMVMPHNGTPLLLRVGLHSGPVTAGIVGAKMPRFCLFGDTVNTASRMESTCEPGAIHVSAATRELLPEENWVATGGVQVKGKGEMQTFLWRPPPPLLSECSSLVLGQPLPTHGSTSNWSSFQALVSVGSVPPPTPPAHASCSGAGCSSAKAGLVWKALPEAASAPLPGSVSPPLLQSPPRLHPPATAVAPSGLPLASLLPPQLPLPPLH